jgi:O-antigen/teichoic acid export membrane protein
MTAAARLLRNGALTASADVLSKLASLAFFALVARRLGGSTLGDYVFAMALTSLLWSFGGFGLDRMAMRDISRDPAAMRRLTVPVATLRATATLVMTAACVGALALAGRDGTGLALVAIMGAGTAITLAASTAQTAFAAFERMELVFATKVPWTFASALTGAAIVLAGGGIVLATAASAIGVGLCATVYCAVLLSRRFGAPSPWPRVRTWPRLLRTAVPFGFQEMLGQVIFRFDTVLLALLAASAVVGAYGAAFRMLEATLFLVWSIGFAVMPMYSYVQAHGGHLARIYEGSLKLALIVMAPIAAVLLVCAEPIVDLIYGLPQYADSVTVLRLLAPAIAIYGVGHLAGMLVLVRRRGRVTIAMTGTVAAFNVAACLVLIPWLHAEGAAIATLASEALLAGLALTLAHRAAPDARLGWALATPVIAAAVMGAAMLPVASTLWIALPVGGVVYAAALLALEHRRLARDLKLFRSIAAHRPDPVTA